MAEGSSTAGRAPADHRSLGELVSSFSLSYLVGILLLGAVLSAGDVWDQLSNTRFLDVLVRSSIVRLTDVQDGFIPHVPDLQYYVESRDPVDWLLVLTAVGILILFWAVKSLQFNHLARFAGVDGTFREHSRAYLYGRGLNRFLPFNLGNIGTVQSLEARGAAPDRAVLTVFMSECFLFFEIVVFGFVGFWLLGLGIWFSSMFWAFVIVGVAYLWVRRRTGRPFHRGGTGHEAEDAPGFFVRLRAVLATLAQQPATLVRLGILSALSFLLQLAAAYTLAQAFTSMHVVLKAQTDLLLIAMVAGSLARFIPVTPGGLGQFEAAFAAALYLGGVGLPEAVTIGVLYRVFRWLTGSILLAFVIRGEGVGTNVRKVLGGARGLTRAEIEGGAA